MRRLSNSSTQIAKPTRFRERYSITRLPQKTAAIMALPRRLPIAPHYSKLRNLQVATIALRSVAKPMNTGEIALRNQLGFCIQPMLYVAP